MPKCFPQRGYNSTKAEVKTVGNTVGASAVDPYPYRGSSQELATGVYFVTSRSRRGLVIQFMPTRTWCEKVGMR